MKLVSIIIPTYNVEDYIEDTIKSCLVQTYTNIEIICIDDCSTDGTFSKLEHLSHLYKMINIYKFENNKGVIEARNFAIEKSNGTYILPLDGDDIIDSTYVEKAVKIIDSSENIGIVYSKANFFGTKTGEWPLPNYSKETIIFSNCIFSCALFRKEDWKQVNGYKSYMKCGWEDFDFWLSIIEIGREVYRINETLFFYRQHNKPTRNTIANQSTNILWKALIQNHLQTYLDNEEFILRVGNPSESNFFKKYKKNYVGKYKKYKRFCITILIILVVQNIFIFFY